jgi:hypothetical protein
MASILAGGKCHMAAQDRLSRDSVDHGRKDTRKAFLSHRSLIAECQTAHDVFQDRVNDLSASGLFLQTDRQLAIGQEIAMTIPLTDSHGMVIKVTGEVVRTTTEGVGVAFKIVFNY